MKLCKSIDFLLVTSAIVFLTLPNAAVADKALDAKVKSNVPACLIKSTVVCVGYIEAIPFKQLIVFENKAHFNEFKRQNKLGFSVTPETKIKPYFMYKTVDYKTKKP